METTVENIFLLVAVLPALYGFVCWIRRYINAQRAASWARETHKEAWNSLHWLAKRNSWAGVEVLIKKGLISGPEVSEFRARDEHLERATWAGLFISALLLFLIIVLKFIAGIFN